MVNIVTGFGETAGAALAAHPDVDKIAFTGSTEVGKLIVQRRGRQPEARVARAGRQVAATSSSPTPTSTARSGAASAIFFNHGQCCCAGSRLFVQQSVFDQVVDGVAEVAEDDQARPGHGPGRREMGPLVSDEQLDRVHRLRRRRPQARAPRSLAGGGRPTAPTGYFVEPTVLRPTRTPT